MFDIGRLRRLVKTPNSGLHETSWLGTLQMSTRTATLLLRPSLQCAQSVDVLTTLVAAPKLCPKRGAESSQGYLVAGLQFDNTETYLYQGNTC